MVWEPTLFDLHVAPALETASYVLKGDTPPQARQSSQFISWHAFARSTPTELI